MSDPDTKYAFFDLDHTILPQDTQVLLAQYIMLREPGRRIYLLWFLPALIPAALGICSIRFMKRLFSSYLWGMSEEKLRNYALDFAEQVVPRVSYPEVVAEIERLRSEGYLLILNSASPEFYLADIARHFGFDHYLGTDMEIVGTMPFLPKINGPNNKQEAKIFAMEKKGIIPQGFFAEKKTFPESWAYSDSSADIPLLSIAEHAVTIHPGEKLAEFAAKNNWSTLTPRRPYQGKWGSKLATIRLAMGFGKKYLRATDDTKK